MLFKYIIDVVFFFYQDMMYKDVFRWSLVFQFYVQLIMVEGYKYKVSIGIGNINIFLYMYRMK